jgi:nickel-type superoxide dismutase maturation protease
MGRERLHPTQRRPATLRAAPVVVGVLVAVLVGLGLRLLGLQRVIVTGESMRPTFEPGDRLLLGRTGRLRSGQVVGLPDPRDKKRLLIKRIHAVSRSTLEVRGDNEGASTDSRDFGPVPRTGVTGRVLYRYGPPGRTGWMPG